MKIAFASDHAGYDLKVILKEYLISKNIDIFDFGSYSTESVDYPDFAHKLAISIENNEYDFGISICGSGNGINMTVNKHQKIRAALCWNEEISKLARLHNNANICSLPARFLDIQTAKNIIDIFITTPFEGGRHLNRINKIPINN